MTRLFCFTVVVATMMLGVMSCSDSPAEADAPATSPSTTKPSVLIVYLSRTENTKTVAEIIHQQVGGDIVRLELVTPYAEDYRATVEQVQRENETGYLPPLKTRVENLKGYDTVFIGFPTWGMQLPPPMKSFVRGNDLSGKTIIPFKTNGGYGKGSSFETVRELCPTSKVLEGMSIDGGREKDGILLAIKDDRLAEVRAQVRQWLQDIGVPSPEAKP